MKITDCTAHSIALTIGILLSTSLYASEAPLEDDKSCPPIRSAQHYDLHHREGATITSLGESTGIAFPRLSMMSLFELLITQG